MGKVVFGDFRPGNIQRHNILKERVIKWRERVIKSREQHNYLENFEASNDAVLTVLK